jgi:glycosyltransferase involved in cell wall biosynthesis
VVEASGAGVGRHVRGLCEGLADRGHRVTVAYSTYRVDAAFRKFVVDRRDEINFVPLRLRREVSPGSDLTSLLQLLRLIRREGPFDIVHGHSSKGGAIARLAGGLSGLPTVYTPHGLIMSSREVSATKRAVYASIERVLGHVATSRIVAVSEGEYEFVIGLRLTRRKRVVLINNGVEARRRENHETTRSSREGAKEPLIFGSIMRFSPPKTPGHLVEAFSRLCRAMPQVPMQLRIAGDGELIAGVQRQIEQEGLGEKVSLLGWRTDVEEVMLGFDVFVLSSLSEAGSYAILDAMDARLPVVSTDVFGTRETVARVPGNVVVPAGDPEALAYGMRQMVDLARRPPPPRGALPKIGQANHEYVRSHFGQEAFVEGNLEVYRGLLRRTRSPWIGSR